MKPVKKKIEVTKAYMVNSIKTDITVSAMGKQIDLPVKDIADGCIGVSLWFDTIDSAKEWGMDGDTISEAAYDSRPRPPKTLLEDSSK